MKRVIISLIALILSSGLMYGGTPGSASAPFLKIAPDARGSAMGEALTGLADDINAVHYNPAGLASLDGINVYLTYALWAFDTTYNYAAVSYTISGIGTAGLSLKMLNLPTIEDKYYYNQSFDNGDFSIAGSFGLSLKKYTGLPLYSGINIKYISEKLADETASGVGFDIGGLYKIKEKIRAGFSLKNLGTKLKYTGYENSLPMTLSVGGAYIFNFSKPLISYIDKINTGLSIDIPNDSSVGVRLGGEFISGRLAKGLTAAFRLGVSLPKEGGFLSYINMGAGIVYNNFGVDIAYNNAGEDIGSLLRVSLVWKYKPGVKKEAKTEKTEKKAGGEESSLEEMKKKLEMLQGE